MAVVVGALMEQVREQVDVLRGTGSLLGGTDRVLGGTDQGACVNGVVDGAMRSMTGRRYS